jgi:hypothetical protein
MNYEIINQLTATILDYQKELSVINHIAEKLLSNKQTINVRLIVETNEAQKEEQQDLFYCDDHKHNVYPIYGLSTQNLFKKPINTDLTVRINGVSTKQSLIMLDNMSRYYNEAIDQAKKEVNTLINAEIINAELLK